MVKYFFELILEDELYDLKRENKVKETLIEIANEEISNLAKENSLKNKTIQTCNEEILKEIKINRELLNEKKKLTIELNETQNAFKIEHDKCKELEEKNHKLEKNFEQIFEELTTEKKKMAELIKRNKQLESTFDELTSQAKRLESLNSELTATLKKRDSEILLINAELKVQKDHVDDIQNKMRNLKNELNLLNEHYSNEKKNKTKIEKQKETLSLTIADMNANLKKLEEQTREALELKRTAEFEANRLKIDLIEEKKEYETSLNSLKKRHEDSVEEMSRQIQQLYLAKSKLEKEKTDQDKTSKCVMLEERSNVQSSVTIEKTLEEKIAFASKRTSSIRQRLRNT